MLQSIAFALRATVSTTIKRSPGQIIFNQDMITRFKSDIDWKMITEQRKLVSIKSNTRENKSRIQHQYKITDQVLIFKSSNERCGQRKIGDPATEGPFHVTKVNRNGTVDIRRGTVI